MKGYGSTYQEGTSKGLMWNAMCMIYFVAGSHPPTQELVTTLVTIHINVAMAANNT